ncbi:hypothetical protein E2K80_11855 [Rhodophyticola sp. CCM32]|uniref:hypothetical protein n=1 Tax=Rhodophyticola sp. CCM32 TaxID=2916397 RepID=UPI00107F0EBD|nr:hypothetical protein [Rhodophyticola sp. CCM32]QBY01334.1 hypothetical protein E2K80_11855 [Rhodophyticola sp. CCM32]
MKMQDTRINYRYFDDHRYYESPGSHTKHIQYDPKLVKRYPMSSGGEFWADADTSRIATSDPNLYIQLVHMTAGGTPRYFMYVFIDGLRIQFSLKDGEPYGFMPRTEGKKTIWNIEDIGFPLRFCTNISDRIHNVDRPYEERYQILTNASKFKSREQQDRACNFVQEALSKYDSPSLNRQLYGHETEAIVIFSEDLEIKMKNGYFVGG